MNRHKRNTVLSVTMLAAAFWLMSGFSETSTVAQATSDPSGRHSSASSRSALSCTRINVTLASSISSETANAGDAWHGTVAENVTTQNGRMIPAGSQVDGVVAGVTSAKRGSRATLELGISSIRVEGHGESIAASIEPAIAGSSPAPYPGAAAGGAVAGAPMGKAMGDGNVEDIIRGATTAGVVAGANGSQVVLSNGTVMSFTVSQRVAMR